MIDKNGILVVLSGPSGCGKDTILRKLMEKNNDVKVSVSMTTREPRENEKDGVHYYFVTQEYFKKMVNENSMLEHAEYAGNYYGTPKAPIDEMLKEGNTVILVIEVQGAEKIRSLYPDAVSIFLMPPSISVLESRLRCRGSEDEEMVNSRLYIAQQEIRRAGEFTYIVINDDLDEAIDSVETIIKAEKMKFSRNKNIISEVIQNV